jgi:hypothetical protein
LRSNAALYNGNTKGPNESIKSGSDDAGWNGVKAGLDGSSTIASLKTRLRRTSSGRSPLGLNRRLSGESKGESGLAEVSSSRI